MIDHKNKINQQNKSNKVNKQIEPTIIIKNK